MIQTVGEINDKNGESLLKMWDVTVESGKRPYYLHKHTRFEISVINKGQGVYETAGGKYHISAGDMMVFSSNERHYISDVGSDGLSITNIQFEPRYLIGHGIDGLSFGHLNFCFTHSPDFKSCINSRDAESLRRHFDAIREELTDRPAEYRLSVKSHLDLMLIELIREFSYQSQSAYATRTQLSNMLKAIKFMDRHISERLTLADISAEAGMSPTYFSALFKQINGITLWDYISSRRTEKAMRLISDGENDSTMLSVALQCGFNNTANFNKIFKKQTGMTPTQYKNSGDMLIN